MTILVTKNLSFIQHAQIDPSWVGKIKVEIGGRISSLGTALILLVEAVARACLAVLAGIAYLISFGLWEDGVASAITQGEKAKMAASLGFDCLQGVLSPERLHDRLIHGPLKAVVRENRLRIGAALIQGKLEKEFSMAQNQMLREGNGTLFQYLEGTVGVAEAKQVGAHNVGVCHYMGRRPTMEDEHLAVELAGKYPGQLFGIFDGHGGPEASKFLKEHLQAKLEQTLIEMNPHGLTDEGIWNALKLTLVRLNQEFRGDAGSTAVIAMILGGKLWTANVGDSRAVLVNGEEIVQLSEDAKPADPRYRQSIKTRGGAVWWEEGMRVNGQLSVARAVGDHFLHDVMSARPKITAIPLSNIRPGSYLIVTCDGIFDVASTRQVGEAVRDHHAAQTSATLARNLVFSAYQARSGDNLSVLIVKLSSRFPTVS